MTDQPPAPAAAPSEVEALLMQARRHTVELSQCALFVDSAPLAKAMTEAADWLRDALAPALRDRQQHAAATAAAVTCCKNCRGTDLRWDFTSKNVSPVQQGRLTTSDVQSEFFLGCDDCSETLRVLSCAEVAKVLQSGNRNRTAAMRAPETKP